MTLEISKADATYENECYNFSLTNWVPCILLWVLTPLEIYYSWRNRISYIPWTGLTGMKLVLNGLLIVCNVVRLSAFSDFVDLSEQIFVFFTLLLTAFIVHFNRSHGQRSSLILAFFWLIETISCLIAYIVTIKDVKSNTYTGTQVTIIIINLINFPLVVGEFVLSLFSDAYPCINAAIKHQFKTPEYEASILSKLFFSWLNNYIFQRETIDFPKVNNILHWQDKLHYVRTKLNEICYIHYAQLLRFKPSSLVKTIFEWKRNQNYIHYELKGVRTWNFPLTSLLTRLLGFDFLFALTTRIISDCMLWVNPFLLNFLFQLIMTTPGCWCAYIVVIVIFLNSLIQCLLDNHSKHIATIASLRVRGIFVSTVYEKILKSFALCVQTLPNKNITQMVTINGTHIKNLVQVLPVVLSVPLQITISLYFLHALIGKTTVVCIVVITLLLLSISVIEHKSRKFYKETHISVEQLKSAQLMKKIFRGLKCLKLLAWEIPFMKLVEGERLAEMSYSHNLFYWSNLQMWIKFSMSYIVQIAVIVVYYVTVLSEHISPQPILISFVVINTLCFILNKLPYNLYVVYTAILSFINFYKFMQLDELNEDILTSHEEKDDSVVLIQSGRFSWIPNQPPVLKDINLKIKQNQLVVITGPTGSGKDSLLATFLSETEKIRGRLSVQGRLAFVPREPWVYNGSIKDNILFGHVPNDFLYDSVVQSCHLTSFLKTTSLGDLTLVGSLGEHLSKQQKLQLCVARAAYSSADIYLMENFISNFDDDTLGESMFNHVLGPEGILKDKTRILITNHLPFIKLADLVIVMHKGFVVFSGSYEESSDLIDEDTEITLNIDYKSSINSTNNSSSKSAPAKIQKWKYSKKLRDCIHFYMQAGGAWNWCLWFFLIGIAIVLFMVSNFALQSWLDATGGAVMDSEYNFTILLYILTSLFCLVVLYINDFVIYNVVETSSISLTNAVLTTIFQLSLKTIEDLSIQWNYIQNILSHLKITECIFPIAISQTLTLSSIIFSLLAIIAVLQPLSCIFALIFFLIYCYMQGVFNRMQYYIIKLEHQSWTPIVTLIEETIEGLITIRAFKREKEFLRNMETHLDETNTYSFISAIVDRWLLVRVNLLVIHLLLFVGLSCVFNEESPATVGIVFLCIWKLEELLDELITSVSALDATSESLSNIQICCHLPREPPWNISTPVTLMWPSLGNVTFKAYVSCQHDKLDLLLRGITCEILPGEKIGIVGTLMETNAILEALFCLIDPIAGNAFIDGVDINTIGLHQVRSQIGIVSIDTAALFPGTVRTNLDPFFEYSDEKVWKAIHESQLSNLVHRFPLGLHDQIHEDDLMNNPKWSNALSLARVRLRNNRLVILDQATSSLEKTVVENTWRCFHDCTLITLATQLNDVMECDRVILLDGGVIRCFQNPQEIINQLSTNLGNIQQ